MIERVKQGPVKWDMIVTLGEPGDPENDPTKLWPSDRKEFKAGTLTITGATPQGRRMQEHQLRPASDERRHRRDRRPGAPLPLSFLRAIVCTEAAGKVTPQPANDY